MRIPEKVKTQVFEVIITRERGDLSKIGRTGFVLLDMKKGDMCTKNHLVTFITFITLSPGRLVGGAPNFERGEKVIKVTKVIKVIIFTGR